MDRRSFLKRTAVTAAAAVLRLRSPFRGRGRSGSIARHGAASRMKPWRSIQPPATSKDNIVMNGERNNIAGDFRASEWAGACYSPDGRWLFANIQSPGVSFAITGPWMSGAL